MRSDRAEFTKDTKAKAFLRSNGHCECGCGQKILGKPEYDHIVSAALGGDNSLENCRVMDPKHHKARSSKENPQIAKSQRIFEKRAGLRKPKGRPLAGTKQSGLRKRMDGTVERR